jgi:dihydroorotase
MEQYDLVIENGHVIDPASGFDAPGALAIRGDRIAAFGATLPAHRAARRIDAQGAVVSPGLIDIHTHVYEWVTNFGLLADDAGVDSGVTTIVDAGSAGAWTFGGFKAYVIERARTDVRSFLSINVAGALKGGMRGDMLHNPGMVDIDELVALAAAEPKLVRGIKCHGESGAFSHWGTEVLAMAADAGRRANLPLYCHTGELFPVIEAKRPSAAAVFAQVVPVLNSGDTIAHVYSGMPDGIMGPGDDVPPAVFDALARGLLFDIGHGVNFSFAIARKMMARGVLPNTISSDLHGDFNGYHDDSLLDYSLAGAMTKLYALGMPLAEVVKRVTLNAARVLRDEGEIGTLAPGSRADVTVLERLAGRWPLVDAQGEVLWAAERLMPKLVVRAGAPIEPSLRLVRDLTRPAVPLAA